MHGLLSYARTFGEDYCVRLAGVPIRNIVEDFMSPNFLAINRRASYIGRIKDGKMMVKHQAVFSLLENLCGDASVATSPRITHLDDQSI